MTDLEAIQHGLRDRNSEAREELGRVEKRIAELEAELSHSILDATAALAQGKADALSRAEKAEARVRELEIALRFYANEGLYFPRSLILLANREGVRLAPVYSEFGETARAALAGGKE